MSIALIAADMDGTLLDRDHMTVPTRNLDALRRASERGVSIALASGRPWCFLRDLAENMGCVDYVLTCNGASVLEVKTGRWLVESGMEEPVWRAVFAVLADYDLPFMAYCQGKSYLEKRMLPAVAARPILSPEFQEAAEQEVIAVDRLDETLSGKRVEKVDTFFIPAAARKEMLERLRKVGHLYLASGLEDNIEISAGDTNKGRALAALCAARGIAAEQVMAFGDGENDVEMLRWAGWSFAMENAAAPAKEAARYLAPPNHQASVGRMVERYVLK